MSCNERVGKGVITWNCDLPGDHPGPHRARENAPSVREREKWEAGEKAKADLAQFQGPAQTTAQRYTENPTEVPGTTAAKVQEAEPTVDPPGSFMAWDLVDGSRIFKREGVFSLLGRDHDGVPEGIDQATALARLDKDRRAREGKPGDITKADYDRRDEALRGKPFLTASEGLKQREGDQPLPTPNDRQDIQSLVLADLMARREVGISRYGTALQAFNGRDALRDLYEELMDACVYIKQVIVERDEGASG